jgi:hypothetical protein
VVLTSMIHVCPLGSDRAEALRLAVGIVGYAVNKQRSSSTQSPIAIRDKAL